MVFVFLKFLSLCFLSLFICGILYFSKSPNLCLWVLLNLCCSVVCLLRVEPKWQNVPSLWAVFTETAWQYPRKNSILLLKFKQSSKFCHTNLSCHTERSEVSINSKCDFSALRHILNSLDFSLTLKMTKFAVLCKWIFCYSSCTLQQPVGSLCANALCSKWQNAVFVSSFYKNGVAKFSIYPWILEVFWSKICCLYRKYPRPKPPFPRKVRF